MHKCLLFSTWGPSAHGLFTVGTGMEDEGMGGGVEGSGWSKKGNKRVVMVAESKRRLDFLLNMVLKPAVSIHYLYGQTASEAPAVVARKPLREYKAYRSQRWLQTQGTGTFLKANCLNFLNRMDEKDKSFDCSAFCLQRENSDVWLSQSLITTLWQSVPFCQFIKHEASEPLCYYAHHHVWENVLLPAVLRGSAGN